MNQQLATRLAAMTRSQRTAFLHPCVEAGDCAHEPFFGRIPNYPNMTIGLTFNVGLE